MATKIMGERCDVHDSIEFMEKLKENKIRFLFQELPLRRNSGNIDIWMRNIFLAGSTGMQSIID